MVMISHSLPLLNLFKIQVNFKQIIKKKFLPYAVALEEEEYIL